MKAVTFFLVVLFPWFLNDTPPVAEKHPHEITIHGDTRVDDYYWMRLKDEQKTAENPDSQTVEVLDYIKAENNYTRSSLKHTETFQETLYNEIVGRIKKDDRSVPYYYNGYWYYDRFEPGKEYPIYCRKKSSLAAAEEIILDENELAEGHDYFAVRGLEISPDNQWLSYGVDTVSRRIYTLHFKNLRTGAILDSAVPNTTGSVAWANDNQTVFYTAKNKVTLLSEEIYRHKLGTSAQSDVKVYSEPDKAFYIGVYRSKSGQYIIIWNSSTLVSDYHILAADNPGGRFRQFTARGQEHEYSIEHFKDRFYIVTNWQAKNFRLMETPVNQTDRSNWKEVIPHREDVQLRGIEVFQDHLVLSERKDGLTQLRILNQKTGSDTYLDFGEPAYAANISVNREFNTNLLRYTYTSLVTPRSEYDYNMDSGEKVLLKRDEVVGGYDLEGYVTERLYATSRDGKRIPISLVYKRGFEKNGNGNLLLYGYGSYGYTMDPRFSSVRLSLLDRGFCFAIAHVRGSQVYGRPWYEDGKVMHKKNTFFDFIDVAEFLISQQFTSPEHLFCMGGSAGGLLIGAVINYRPDLFKGAVAAVPFVDVVTTMLDESIPLTTNEFDEWGNPKEKEYYDYMLSYSPYDNVTAQDYPNLLVTSGFFDSQVQYWEPLKWVAKLRAVKTGNSKLYLHMNMDAGHGGKSGRFRRYRETALEYAFMLDLAGIKE
ncbi:MAG: S9 family peptidase [Fidelibacterota bacterium]